MLYAVNSWDGESECVLRHAKHGKLDVTMVAGCPELPEQEVVDLMTGRARQGSYDSFLWG